LRCREVGGIGHQPEDLACGAFAREDHVEGAEGAHHEPPRGLAANLLYGFGPPGAIGEKFTVSQHGHEDISHEQRLLYMEKQRVVQYRISCTYGWTAVLRRTICPCDRDPWLL
jgi:hypothetical protein